MSKFLVRKAAVLGAGVMGAQIAAHLANAGVQPILFELAAEGKDKNANVRKAIDGAREARAQPARHEVGRWSASRPPTTTSTWRSSPNATSSSRPSASAWTGRSPSSTRWRRTSRRGAIFASNTSGLSITELSNVLPASRAPALLRHPLLQPAALHAPGGDHPDGRDRPGHPRRRSRPSSPPRSARASSAPRTRPTSWPTAWASSRCSRRCTTRSPSGWASTRWTRSPARPSAAPRAPPTAPPTWWASTRWRTW